MTLPAVLEAGTPRSRGEVDIDEQQLIDRAKAGDELAAEQLVRRYQDVAFRVAYLITREAEDARDATQNAFIRAFRSISTFRDGSPFRPWILQIVANEAKNRRAMTGRHYTAPLDDQLVARDPSPEEVAERAENRQLVTAAMERLQDEDRQIISYRYFLELTESEMAALLNCPKGTVKSRLSRAVSRLRVELATAAEVPAHD